MILGGEINGRDAAARGVKVLKGACFNATKVKTNIGILQDPGYDEPWIIARDCPASEYKTRDYGIRWGIEPMFSDFKTRGFGITETQVEHADRIERLMQGYGSGHVLDKFSTLLFTKIPIIYVLPDINSAVFGRFGL